MESPMDANEGLTTISVPAAPPAAKPILEPHSVRRVHRVAEHIDAQSYLEIGVFNGKTFNSINLPKKVGVDPRFGFNVEEHKREGVEFIPLTSDEFFIGNETSRHFDIIF